jgi:shikimate dehydrogenase
MTDRYAVIGNPVAHSQSPRIHALFAQHVGHAIEYGRILGEPGHFREAVDRFREAGGRGVNVTVPFKLDAFEIANDRTERATHAGAVNTLEFEAGRIVGDNTDGAGLVRDIAGNHGFAIAGRRVLLMGAGGAARGVLLPLLHERPASIAIANRTVDKACALAERFAGMARGIPVRAGGYETFAGERFDLVINATSASLERQLPPLPAQAFAPDAFAYDMMYGEAAGPFVAHARSLGAARAVDGLGMLVEQAAESFLLWRGVRPPTAPVLAVLRRDHASGATTSAPNVERTR